jgi:hypothetical protein
MRRMTAVISEPTTRMTIQEDGHLDTKIRIAHVSHQRHDQEIGFRRSSQSAESAAAPVEKASRSTAGRSTSSLSSIVPSVLIPRPQIGVIGVADLQRLLLTQSDDVGRRFPPAVRRRLPIDHRLVWARAYGERKRQVHQSVPFEAHRDSPFLLCSPDRRLMARVTTSFQ